MADRPQPPLNDALMALFAGAAPLFDKARAAGLFRDRPSDVTPPSATTPEDRTAALHDIIVAQAQKIVALEAEIARLKG